MTDRLTFWLRFLAWPLGFVGLLALVEFIKSLSLVAPSRMIVVVLKVSAALAAYGIGSVAPYLYSTEFLHDKYAEMEDKGGVAVVKLDKKGFDRAQILLFIFFIIGLLFWVGQISL